MTDCQNCELEKRVLDLEKTSENQEVRIKQLESNDANGSNSRKGVYDKLEKLAMENQKHEMEITNIFEKLESIDSKTAKIDRKIDEINNRPAKNMGQFTSAIIGAVGSAFGTGAVALILYALMQTVK